MEKKLQLFRGEDDASSNVTDFEQETLIDQAVADARDVVLTSSNTAVNQTFFMLSGFSPMYLVFADLR